MRHISIRKVCFKKKAKLQKKIIWNYICETLFFSNIVFNSIDYQKLILQLISQQWYIIIDLAVKYQTSSGERRVKVS